VWPTYIDGAIRSGERWKRSRRRKKSRRGSDRGERPFSIESVGQAAGPGAACGAIAKHLARRLETELGNHPRGSRVFLEMADGEIGEILFLEGVENERLRRLGSVAHAPIGLADPVAHFGVRVFCGAIADAADQRGSAIDGKGDAFFAGL